MLVERSGPITDLYAFIADPKGTGDESLICNRHDIASDKLLAKAILMVPIIKTNKDSEFTLLSAKVWAKKIAKETGKEILLIRFTRAEVIESIT